MADEQPNITPDNYIGNFPIRQEIAALPADEPKSLRLGWTFYEVESTTNNTFDYSNKAFETTEADKYRTHSSQHVLKEHLARRIHTTQEILPELKGRPWNNLALSAVLMFDPYAIRVTKDSVTLDAMPKRITVWLREDDASIRKIEMEVSPAAIGIKSGVDFNYKMKNKELPPPSDKPLYYYNPEAVKKINI